MRMGRVISNGSATRCGRASDRLGREPQTGEGVLTIPTVTSRAWSEGAANSPREFYEDVGVPYERIKILRLPSGSIV